MVFNIFVRFIIQLLMVFFCALAQHEGRNCTLLSGGRGRCMKIERCAPPMQPLLVNSVTWGICKEDEKFSICCPLFENIVTPPIANPKCAQKCLLYNHRKSNPWNFLYNMQHLPVFKSFIVDGNPALEKEFPHMAALGYETENEIHYRCGGSLISEQFILTAAHCVSSSEIGELKHVRLGDLYLRNPNSNNQYLQEFGISQIFRHPKYIPPALYNDIALIQLDHPAQITHYVKPACLPTTTNLPNSKLIATGWGRSQFSGPTSERLMKAALDYFPHVICQKAYSSVPARQLPSGILNETQICAGDVTEQMDTCQGDSGGPLQFVNFHYFNAYYVIIGITSFGKGCGTSTNPGVYTKVFPYISWIEEIVWSD